MAEPTFRRAAGVVAALATVPLLALVVRAFADEWRAPALIPQRFGLRGVEIAFSGASATAFANSLVVAVATATLALVVAWPAARVLGERRLRHPALVFLALTMPLLVPGYAVGTGLTEWFIRLDLDGTLPALVAGHLTFVLPYVVLVLLSGFGPRLTALEEVARSSGLSPSRRLLWVTLPAAAPTVAAAALIGFLVSWSDYGTSLAVGGGRPMLPVVLLPFVGADPQVAATLALLFLAPAIAVLAVAVRAGRMPL
ncbi:MAG: ABC transporter permease subunit [Solirubrobacterales bacterium]|nr:ABC transporter permease subunit [Solirubrobacterales bacterium]